MFASSSVSSHHACSGAFVQICRADIRVTVSHVIISSSTFLHHLVKSKWTIGFHQLETSSYILVWKLWIYLPDGASWSDACWCASPNLQMPNGQFLFPLMATLLSTLEINQLPALLGPVKTSWGWGCTFWGCCITEQIVAQIMQMNSIQVWPQHCETLLRR